MSQESSAKSETTTEETPKFGPVGYPTGHAVPGGESADNVVKFVTQIGAGWAKYGLTLGRMALTQSAKTLESTSELLGALAKKVETAAEGVAAKVDSKDETKSAS
jgi:hypothetical protein